MVVELPPALGMDHLAEAGVAGKVNAVRLLGGGVQTLSKASSQHFSEAVGAILAQRTPWSCFAVQLYSQAAAQ